MMTPLERIVNPSLDVIDCSCNFIVGESFSKCSVYNVCILKYSVRHSERYRFELYVDVYASPLFIIAKRVWYVAREGE